VLSITRDEKFRISKTAVHGRMAWLSTWPQAQKTTDTALPTVQEAAWAPMENRKINLLLLPIMRHPFPGSAAHNLVTIPTELPIYERFYKCCYHTVPFGL